MRASTKERHANKYDQPELLRRQALNDLEEKILDQIRLKAKLNYDEEEKTNALISTEESIATEKERHRWQLENLISKKEAYEQFAQEKIEQLTDEQNIIKLETSNLDWLIAENERLQVELKKTAFEYYSMARKNAAEREEKNQNAFDTKMRLDQELRSCVKYFHQEYEVSCHQEMTEEVVVAKKTNTTLLNESNDRDIKIVNLVNEQKKSYDKLMQMKLMRELAEAGEVIQLENEKKLKTNREQNQRFLSRMKERVAFLQRSIVDLKKKVALKDELQLKQAHIRTYIERIKSYRREKLRECVILGEDLVQRTLDITQNQKSVTKSVVAFEEEEAQDCNSSAFGKRLEASSPLASLAQSETNTSSSAQESAADPVNYAAIWSSAYDDCKFVSLALRLQLRKQRGETSDS